MSAFHILQLRPGAQLDLFDPWGHENLREDPRPLRPAQVAPRDDPRATEGRLHRSMQILLPRK